MLFYFEKNMLNFRELDLVIFQCNCLLRNQHRSYTFYELVERLNDDFIFLSNDFR